MGSGKTDQNLAAYEYVLRGWGTVSIICARASMNDFAILDRNYADADAALGFAHFKAATSGWSEFRAQELKRGRNWPNTDFGCDLNAWLLLSSFVSLARKRFDLALVHIDRALEINPSDADNYVYRGALDVGEAEEALPWLEVRCGFTEPTASLPSAHGLRITFFADMQRLSMPATVGLARHPGRGLSGLHALRWLPLMRKWTGRRMPNGNQQTWPFVAGADLCL